MPVTKREELDTAQRATHAGSYSEAIPTFRRLTENESIIGGEAAYCLAVLYETGSGVVQSSDEAERLFAQSETYGYSPATYQLAGYSLRKGQLKDALERYRSVAEQNPSAAYWVYRLLAENPELRTETNEEQLYLKLAVKQGHLMARKALLLAKIKGRHGITAIPSGVAGLLPLYRAMFRAVKDRDKSKFT
jgi:TPR repeat protein